MAEAAAKPVPKLGYRKPTAPIHRNATLVGKAPREIEEKFQIEPPKGMEAVPIPMGPTTVSVAAPKPGAGAGAGAGAAAAGAAAAIPKPTPLKSAAKRAPPKPVAHASERVNRENRIADYFERAAADDDRMHARHKEIKTDFEKIYSNPILFTRYPAQHKYEDAQKHEEEDNKYLTDTTVYMPSTRKDFYKFINTNYPLFNLILDPQHGKIDSEACEKLLKGGPERVEPFLYQRFVKEYTRMATPYRGLLVYHGLGSGKTCSAIAAMEALYGVSNRRVIVMTPFSLRGNFINEIKFCGFRHLSTKNHWVELPLINRNVDPTKDGTPNSINEIYARSVLSLSRKYLEDLKTKQFEKTNLSKTPKIWVPDFEQEPNYDTLSKQDQTLIQAQINETINNRVEFISYNGVTAKTLKRWACEERGHFDNAVIVIDEVHNLIRLMQGTIEPYLFERSKRRRKIAVEPVTPARWEPGLCGKLENYKRGYLFYRLLTDARNSKIVALSGTPLINFPEEIGILSNVLAGYIDCIEFKVNTSEPSRLQQMRTLVEKEPRVDVVRWKLGAGTASVMVSLFNEGYVKVLDAASRHFEGVKYTKEAEGHELITTIAGRITKALQDNGFVPGTPSFTSYPRLPPDQTTFRQTFVDLATSGIKKSNEDVLRKRLTGLVSYYKGSKADFVPQVTKDEDVFCDLSTHAFKQYIVARSEEIKGETGKEKPDRAEALYAAVEMFAQSKNPSSYRFRSRAICNFAFPDAIPRPFPNTVAALEEETKPIEEGVEIAEVATNPDEDAAAAAAVAEEEKAADKLLEEEAEVAAVSAALMPPAKPKAAEVAAPVGAAVAPAPKSVGRTIREDPVRQSQIMELVRKIKEPGAGAGGGQAQREAYDDLVKMGEDPAKYGINPMHGGGSEEESSGEAVVEAVAGHEAVRAKTYEELIADTMTRLTNERSKYMQLNPPAGAGNPLSTYSMKLDKILRKLVESPGPNLVYSQFKTVEGLGVLGVALKANGYEELKITGPDDSLKLTAESEASIRKGPAAGVKRFITFSGDGSKDNKAATLLLFNSRLNELPAAIQRVFQESGWDVNQKYLHGEVCKVIGITGAGAEGISLRNVRQVHIMEPYWNKVRLEQVKGRAVRICSHMDLPMAERNVEIYTYITKFSDAQLGAVSESEKIPNIIGITDSETTTDPRTGVKKTTIYTSDQMVYNVSVRKEKINQSLLSVLKEVAVDCVMNAPDNNPDGQPPIECFQTAPAGPGEDPKMFDPELQQDIIETASTKRGVPPAAVAVATRELASTAPAIPRAIERYAEKIAIRDKKTDEVFNYLVGPPDLEGKCLLYADNDPMFIKPLGEIMKDPLKKYAKPVFYAK